MFGPALSIMPVIVAVGPEIVLPIAVSGPMSLAYTAILNIFYGYLIN